MKTWAEDSSRYCSEEDTTGQQICEKMFSVAQQQGNANPNHSEVSPCTHEDGDSKNPKNEGWQGCGVIVTLCTAGGDIQWDSGWRNGPESPQKIKNRTTS